MTEAPELVLKALRTGGVLYRLIAIGMSGFVLVFAAAINRKPQTIALLAFPLLGYKTKVAIMCALVLASGFAVAAIGSFIVAPIAIRTRIALEKLLPKVLRPPESAPFDHKLANLAAHYFDRSLNAELFEGSEATMEEWESFVETLGSRYMSRSPELAHMYDLYRLRADTILNMGTALLLATPFARGLAAYALAAIGTILIVLFIPFADQYPIILGQIVGVGFLDERFPLNVQPDRKNDLNAK
jgi:hypothetical protein